MAKLRQPRVFPARVSALSALSGGPIEHDRKPVLQRARLDAASSLVPSPTPRHRLGHATRPAARDSRHAGRAEQLQIRPIAQGPRTSCFSRIAPRDLGMTTASYAARTYLRDHPHAHVSMYSQSGCSMQCSFGMVRSRRSTDASFAIVSSPCRAVSHAMGWT